MYQLHWWPLAFDRFNELLQSNLDRKAEFAAVLRKMSVALTTDPLHVGESREFPYRVVIIDQFTVRFRPAPDKKLVYVVRVHLRKRRT
jgi:hypothetical protein